MVRPTRPLTGRRAAGRSRDSPRRSRRAQRRSAARLGRGGGRRRFGGGAGEMPIFGDFTAALQQDNGVWTVVRSTPEAFPSAWQMQTSGWLLGGFLLVASAGYLFARRISAPLRRFAEAAETLGRDPHAPK